ncbi:hypothetical protein EG68_12101, partial [Paragonimus skrjabini miyazakii]
GCRVSSADCYRPAIKAPLSFDSGANLPLWRRKVDLYLANIPTVPQGPYISSLLSGNIQEVLWASDLSTTATAAAIWSKLEELYPVPDNRKESRTTVWSRRQLLGETVEDYANQLQVLVARAFPDTPKGTKDLLVFERFIEGIRDLPTRRRFIQEPPTDLSCAIRLARSYAKSAELVPERDGNCMTVRHLTATTSIRNHTRSHHCDPPQWNRGIQGLSQTHQRPWCTVVPSDGRYVRPPMGRWKLRVANGTMPRSLSVTRVPFVIDGVSVFHDFAGRNILGGNHRM